MLFFSICFAKKLTVGIIYKINEKKNQLIQSWTTFTFNGKSSKNLIKII